MLYVLTFSAGFAFGIIAVCLFLVRFGRPMTTMQAEQEMLHLAVEHPGIGYRLVRKSDAVSA